MQASIRTVAECCFSQDMVVILSQDMTVAVGCIAVTATFVPVIPTS